jgi:hypothetical protein
MGCTRTRKKVHGLEILEKKVMVLKRSQLELSLAVFAEFEVSFW